MSEYVEDQPITMSMRIAAAIQAKEARGKIVEKIFVSNATLAELEATAIRPDDAPKMPMGWGIPLVVSGFLSKPFVLITKDAPIMSDAFWKVLAKLKEKGNE